MVPAKNGHSKAERPSNRLVHEKSPYLLQHAHNPVDWHPWGDEAFAAAREKDKPVFLSIGYSTCHWCHVMEEESFSDPDIARLMNEHFVCVKVDREERPDIDKVYMAAVVAMAGHGGWPLTVFLTPERRPFFGGTYFPPEERMGMPGLRSVLLSVSEAWTSRKEELLGSAEYLLEILRRESAPAGAENSSPGEGMLRNAYERFAESFDSHFGGFGPAPKFPSAHCLSFLLRYWKRTGEPRARQMVEKTLDAISNGGIYDHLGGGFHRYSTDERWHVPHFEKMLYDQAMLSKACVEAFRATKKSVYARKARETFDYVLREMTAEEGAFYSAEDADSPVNDEEPETKREGAFYVWTKDEIVQALGEEEAEIVSYYFGVEPAGNVRQDPHGVFEGKSILYVTHTAEETAARFNCSVRDTEEVLNRSRQRLFSARSGRPRPHLDDKIMVDWNGLMMASLAIGSRALEEPRYLCAARQSAEFVLANLVREDGRLLHTYRDGEARIPGTIEDYAFLAYGLFELYEASFDIRYLEEAIRLAQEMVRLFWDEEGAGFFFAASDAEPLVVRHKELTDGAFPSGNSVGTLVLTLLGRLTAERGFDSKAHTLLKMLSAQVARAPNAFAHLLSTLDFVLGPSREIVIVGERNGDDSLRLLAGVNREFMPNALVALLPPSGKERKRLTDLMHFLKGYTLIDDMATAYVCENYACKAPVTDPAQLQAILSSDPEP